MRSRPRIWRGYPEEAGASQHTAQPAAPVAVSRLEAQENSNETKTTTSLPGQHSSAREDLGGGGGNGRSSLACVLLLPTSRLSEVVNLNTIWTFAALTASCSGGGGGVEREASGDSSRTRLARRRRPVLAQSCVNGTETVRHFR